MYNEPQLHIFGEVLFDHFTDGSRILGGAPFNVAWHLQAFGQAPRFISRIGDDAPGHKIMTLMDTWGMRRDALQTDHRYPTGSVQVIIKDDEPHYEIVPDCAYDFISGDLFKNNSTEGILYHGSLGVRNPIARSSLEVIKAKHQGKIFIDVNLRSPWWNRESLIPLLYDADWVKLNEAELAELHTEDSSLEITMQKFCAHFDLETLVVTRGKKGAVAWDRHQHYVAAKTPASVTVVDTVGAGDAFAAILLLGLSKRWSLETTLERAQAFASALVGRRGATIADTTFYRTFSKQWD
jgi:fructokinase